MIAGRGVAMRGVVVAVALSAGFAATPASALSQRTFVATYGSDVFPNTCKIYSPCRNVSYALLNTSAGGEIVILDSGEYGSVLIDRSVSVIAPPDVHAVFPLIAIGAPGETVTLRGLTIQPGGLDTGISVNAATRVIIDRCIVSGQGLKGINITTSAPLDIVIRDSVIERNEFGGIDIGAMDTNVVLNRVRVVGNGANFVRSGIRFGPQAAGASIALAVRDSVVAYNGDSGLDGGSNASSLATALVQRTLIVGNGGYGVSFSGAGGSIAVANSTAAGNTAGGISASQGATLTAAGNAVSRNGGPGFIATDVGTIFHSFGDNALDGNNGGGAQTSGTITVVPRQ